MFSILKNLHNTQEDSMLLLPGLLYSEEVLRSTQLPMSLQVWGKGTLLDAFLTLQNNLRATFDISKYNHAIPADPYKLTTQHYLETGELAPVCKAHQELEETANLTVPPLIEICEKRMNTLQFLQHFGLTDILFHKASERCAGYDSADTYLTNLRDMLPYLNMAKLPTPLLYEENNKENNEENKTLLCNEILNLFEKELLISRTADSSANLNIISLKTFKKIEFSKLASHKEATNRAAYILSNKSMTVYLPPSYTAIQLREALEEATIENEAQLHHIDSLLQKLADESDQESTKHLYFGSLFRKAAVTHIMSLLTQNNVAMPKYVLRTGLNELPLLLNPLQLAKQYGVSNSRLDTQPSPVIDIHQLPQESNPRRDKKNAKNTKNKRIEDIKTAYKLPRYYKASEGEATLSEASLSEANLTALSEGLNTIYTLYKKGTSLEAMYKIPSVQSALHLLKQIAPIVSVNTINDTLEIQSPIAKQDLLVLHSNYITVPVGELFDVAVNNYDANKNTKRALNILRTSEDDLQDTTSELIDMYLNPTRGVTDVSFNSFTKLLSLLSSTPDKHHSTIASILKQAIFSMDYILKACFLENHANRKKLQKSLGIVSRVFDRQCQMISRTLLQDKNDAFAYSRQLSHLNTYYKNYSTALTLLTGTCDNATLNIQYLYSGELRRNDSYILPNKFNLFNKASNNDDKLSLPVYVPDTRALLAYKLLDLTNPSILFTGYYNPVQDLECAKYLQAGLPFSKSVHGFELLFNGSSSSNSSSSNSNSSSSGNSSSNSQSKTYTHLFQFEWSPYLLKAGSTTTSPIDALSFFIDNSASLSTPLSYLNPVNRTYQNMLQGLSKYNNIPSPMLSLHNIIPQTYYWDETKEIYVQESNLFKTKPPIEKQNEDVFEDVNYRRHFSLQNCTWHNSIDHFDVTPKDRAYNTPISTILANRVNLVDEFLQAIENKLALPKEDSKLVYQGTLCEATLIIPTEKKTVSQFVQPRLFNKQLNYAMHKKASSKSLQALFINNPLITVPNQYLDRHISWFEKTTTSTISTTEKLSYPFRKETLATISPLVAFHSYWSKFLYDLVSDICFGRNKDIRFDSKLQDHILYVFELFNSLPYVAEPYLWDVVILRSKEALLKDLLPNLRRYLNYWEPLLGEKQVILDRKEKKGDSREWELYLKIKEAFYTFKETGHLPVSINLSKASTSLEFSRYKALWNFLNDLDTLINHTSLEDTIKLRGSRIKLIPYGHCAQYPFVNLLNYLTPFTNNIVLQDSTCLKEEWPIAAVKTTNGIDLTLLHQNLVNKFTFIHPKFPYINHRAIAALLAQNFNEVIPEANNKTYLETDKINKPSLSNILRLSLDPCKISLPAIEQALSFLASAIYKMVGTPYIPESAKSQEHPYTGFFINKGIYHLELGTDTYNNLLYFLGDTVYIESRTQHNTSMLPCSINSNLQFQFAHTSVLPQYGLSMLLHNYPGAQQITDNPYAFYFKTIRDYLSFLLRKDLETTEKDVENTKQDLETTEKDLLILQWILESFMKQDELDKEVNKNNENKDKEYFLEFTYDLPLKAISKDYAQYVMMFKYTPNKTNIYVEEGTSKLTYEGYVIQRDPINTSLYDNEEITTSTNGIEDVESIKNTVGIAPTLILPTKEGTMYLDMQNNTLKFKLVSARENNTSIYNNPRRYLNVNESTKHTLNVEAPYLNNIHMPIFLRNTGEEGLQSKACGVYSTDYAFFRTLKHETVSPKQSYDKLAPYFLNNFIPDYMFARGKDVSHITSLPHLIKETFKHITLFSLSSNVYSSVSSNNASNNNASNNIYKPAMSEYLNPSGLHQNECFTYSSIKEDQISLMRRVAGVHTDWNWFKMVTKDQVKKFKGFERFKGLESTALPTTLSTKLPMMLPISKALLDLIIEKEKDKEKIKNILRKRLELLRKHQAKYKYDYEFDEILEMVDTELVALLEEGGEVTRQS